MIDVHLGTQLAVLSLLIGFRTVDISILLRQKEAIFVTVLKEEKDPVVASSYRPTQATTGR